MPEETNDISDLEQVDAPQRDEDTFPDPEPAPEVETEHLGIEDPDDLRPASSKDDVTDTGEESPDSPDDVGGDVPDTEPDKEEDWLDQELLGFARERGLSELQARRFGSKERLEYAILEDLERSKANEDARAVETPAGKPKAEAKFKLDLDEEVVDPEVIKAFNALSEHYEQSTGELQQTIAGLGSLLGDLIVQQEEAWFDNQVNNLGEEYKEIFGTGTGTTLPKDSPEWKARNELLGELRAHQLVHRGQLSREESFKRSLRALHGEKTINKERTKIRSEIKKRSTQTIARTTRTTGKGPVTGEEAAVTAVREKLRALGALD